MSSSSILVRKATVLQDIHAGGPRPTGSYGSSRLRAYNDLSASNYSRNLYKPGRCAL